LIDRSGVESLIIGNLLFFQSKRLLTAMPLADTSGERELAASLNSPPARDYA